MNVARHAQASQVWVEIECSTEAVAVSVRDNGTGLAPDLAALPAGHYGLMGLWERARLIGGSLQITSEPGQGTLLCFRMPRVATIQHEVSYA